MESAAFDPRRFLRCGASGLLLFVAAALGAASAVSAAPGESPTPSAESRAARVTAAFADLAATPGPGCAVGIARDEQLVHAAGYGLANLEYDIPLDADSVFRVGSVSKQFTAAAVALAVERSLLSLDDTLGQHLPELDESVHPVTIRQVIGHVGGLPDYESQELDATLRDAMGNPFTFGNEDHLHTEEFFEATRAVVLKQPPETRWEYSNIGYFWLGQIVERVTGESLRDFADRHLFAPAGMRDSQFNDDANRVVKRRASGYSPLEDGGYEVFETNLDWVGEGGVYTSVNDLARWNAQFAAPTIGADPETLRARLITPVSELPVGDDAGAPRYAFGLNVGTDAEGRRYVAHSGGWVAFRAYYKRFLDDGLAYWVLCNRWDADIGRRTTAIERAYLD